MSWFQGILSVMHIFVTNVLTKWGLAAIEWNTFVKCLSIAMLPELFSDFDEDIDNTPVTPVPNITDLRPAKPVPWEKKYIEEIQTLPTTWSEEDKSNKLATLGPLSVVEYTPRGNVLMKYNVSDRCFDYYSDFTVPYNWLDVVARKYVWVFKCRPLYRDMSITYRPVRNREPVANSAFAVFKQYNKGSLSSAPRRPNQPIAPPLTTLIEKTQNQFTRRGKLSNYSVLLSGAKERPVSFSSFKRCR